MSLATLFEKIALRALAGGEYESLRLRAYFVRKYGIEIGLYSYGCFDRWRIPPRTRIGRYCSFAKTTRILDADHPIDALTTHPFLYAARFGVVDRDAVDPAPTVVEDDAWFGHNVTITPGCKFIGRGAVIGAGAVVTKDVPRYAVMAGVPAKRIGARFDEATAAAIEASQWWLLDKAGLKALLERNRDFVMRPSAEAAMQSHATAMPSTPRRQDPAF